MMQTPGGNGRLEPVKFHSPSNQGDNRHAPANPPGIRHIAFAVEDIDAVVGLRARGAELVGEMERYEDSYRELLLTMTAGRRFWNSPPRAGSKSTQ
jgi:4-hydroxyphenylpyruvate dioxygenase-like putative hemolysin